MTQKPFWPWNNLKKKESVVVPIIVRPCLWQVSKFSHLNVLPKDGKPITTWTNEDEAWLDVAKGILLLAKKINKLTNNKRSKELKDLNFGSPCPPRCGPDFQEEPDTPVRSRQEEILRFLRAYNRWYFSPLRIQRWGGRQQGFEFLSNYDTYSLEVELEKLVKLGKLRTTKSKKGNIIYKLI